MPTPNKAKIPVGFVLADKYRITRELGRGGMAAVYEAENLGIGKRVAIKVLAQELTSSAIVVERFLREARAAAAIRSPYICDVYDSGSLEDGRPFLVLELLEGESLYERMTKVRFIDLETTLRVITQTCRGLTKAHTANIVHRDLKPENIFITKDEEGELLAKILDFGLAKFYAPMEGDEKKARLTREGAVFGTPAYMSPEQVRGQGAVDHRADLWALACITYECLTGKTVWATEQGVAMTFAQIANSPLPDPAQIRPDLPQSFSDWFNKALDRDIEVRFQTAKEFADSLNQAFSHGPPSFSAIHTNLPHLSSSNLEDAAASGSNPSVPSVRRHDPSALTDPGVDSSGTPNSGDVPAVVNDPNSRASLARGSKAHFAAPDARDVSMPNSGAAVPQASGGSSRAMLGLLALVVIGGAGYVGYNEFLKPPPPPLPTTTPPVTAPPPKATASAPVRDTLDPDKPEGLPWRSEIAEAQKLLADGKTTEAGAKLKAAFADGGHGVPRTMLEHYAQGTAGQDQPCKLRGLARPRAYDLVDERARVVGAARPSIAVGPRGPLYTWSDARDGQNHAFVTLLDDAMRPVAEPIDVTPEGTSIGEPRLTTVGEKFVLTYWDAKGPESGVYARMLNDHGQIASAPVAVAPDDRQAFLPSIANSGDGFVMVWSRPTDAAVEDLFMRQLDGQLQPAGEIKTVTAFQPMPPIKSRARYASAGVLGDHLNIVFKLERDPSREVQLLRIPLAELSKAKLPDRAPASRDDLHIGELELVNSDQGKAESPRIVCGGEACFIVWYDIGGGAWAAYLNASSDKPIWRKKLSKTGTRVAVGMAPTGAAQLVWFDRGRVLTAPATRDGVGTESTIARVSGDQPVPSIAAGTKPGEWYLAWLDYETGHLEPYGARVICE